jgi:two-component system chemotaxis response regulator CheY
MFKSVLVLDLDSIHCNEVAASLYSHGFRVMRCDSIVNLEAVLKGTWDLILTEWEFYQLSGASLISHLRPERQPVMVFSNRDTGSIAAEAMQAGAKGVFSKHSRAELVEEVERQLNGSPTAQSWAEDNWSILVVDDSVTMRRFVRMSLEEGLPGARMLEAEDGRTALKVLTGSRVDLIVTDLQMPGMDGHSFVQLLRRNGTLKRKPVMVVTAADDEALLRLVAEDGYSALIRKPAEPQALVATARRLMGSQAALRS